MFFKIDETFRKSFCQAQVIDYHGGFLTPIYQGGLNKIQNFLISNFLINLYKTYKTPLYKADIELPWYPDNCSQGKFPPPPPILPVGDRVRVKVTFRVGGQFSSGAIVLEPLYLQRFSDEFGGEYKVINSLKFP